mmetsp:Transcript_19179/g.28106  ORF Transcript_19179/g.28106 Transcript_19179/m.28106 type:complete len:637 (+) Transcript_19179:135-2045(+)|eukprot:CAMPEP_0195521436 /NCGR_PEP_ID=MMETSP0794_2-20130614/18650_1 /TAXON_ID=515487 /ORGANISM="Stephanopyxis turris, Strain CCMP 815" /LENGTH=636 /DNA_ID=CAMNT_0040650987 /DNA_START=112 /DNA_END=2022 /DNA_ORIENTATION=+
MATQTAAAPAPAPAPAVNNAAPAANNAAPAANVDGAQIHRNTALYVGDLAPTVNEADLFEMFNAVASVASVRVCRHAISRKSLGYAYVNFHTIADAERVLDTMNYTEIKGRISRLMWSQRDPSFRRSGSGNIFIKNLAPGVDSRDLNDTFSTFGNIISCKVVIDRETGESRGYGFVQFEQEEDAQNAIKDINGKEISGRTVFVGKFEPAERRHKKQQWTNLFVKNIPSNWDDAKLRSLFEKFGEISSIRLDTEAAQGDEKRTHKGYGFVDFKEHESAVKAQDELNGKVIEGEFKKLKNVDDPVPLKLYVGRFQKKRERTRLLQEMRAKEKQNRIKEFLGKNLYVRNLHEDCTDEMLRKEFAAHGTITSAKVMTNDNGQSRGFGFVCFATAAEATKAHKALQAYLFMGKPLYIAMWQPREERQQYLNRNHDMQMAGPAGMARGGPGGLMPMVNRYNMPMFPAPLGGYPRPMFGRGPAGNVQGGRGNGQFPYQYGRGMVGGRGRGRGRGRGQGRPDPQLIALQQQQQQQQQQALAHQQALAQQQAQAGQQAQQPSGPLTASQLAHANPQQQKNLIGEQLYPLVQGTLASKPEHGGRAGKITGMLLEGVETAELLVLLESPNALKDKVDEALAVLLRSQ